MALRLLLLFLRGRLTQLQAPRNCALDRIRSTHGFKELNADEPTYGWGISPKGEIK
jgi:hypothetical protein